MDRHYQPMSLHPSAAAAAAAHHVAAAEVAAFARFAAFPAEAAASLEAFPTPGAVVSIPTVRTAELRCTTASASTARCEQTLFARMRRRHSLECAAVAPAPLLTTCSGDPLPTHHRRRRHPRILVATTTPRSPTPTVPLSRAPAWPFLRSAPLLLSAQPRVLGIWCRRHARRRSSVHAPPRYHLDHHHRHWRGHAEQSHQGRHVWWACRQCKL